MGGPGAGPGALAAAMLGLLATALLIPGAGSLRCHSHISVLHRSLGGKQLDIITHNGTESCAPALSTCLEAVVTLRAGDTSVTLTQRGCGDGHPTADTDTPAAPTGFLRTQAHIRSCRSDLCNAPGTGTEPPSQGTAPGPRGPTQCYVGLSLDPQPHVLQRLTCEGDKARCYHGNSTFTAGKLVVPVFEWSCQAPPCALPLSRRFGPVQLSQAGTCCSGSLCNRPGAPAQAAHGPEEPTHQVPTGVPGRHPRHRITARKDHKHPGPISSTAAPHPETADYDIEPPGPETPDFDTEPPETTDFDTEPPETTDFDYKEPGHKGATPRSTRPHPTQPGKKDSPSTNTARQPYIQKVPNPGPHKSQAPGPHFCPLLVVLGTALLGL
ncbi:uncharacterized protein LOC142819548 [Pelodiscus sinensis]|uniref:uncharacterized protein LOC142819548 n=1 Tax=Pelodiscus sinensis TaxID=13735 RepID=UPI003F6B6AC3